MSEHEPEQRPQIETLSFGTMVTGVFTAPKSVFDAINARGPRAKDWLFPLAIFLVLQSLVTVLVFSDPALSAEFTGFIDQALQESVDNGELTAEQANTLSSMTEDVLRNEGFIILPFATVILALVFSFVLWLIGRAASKESLSYSMLLAISGPSWIVLGLETLVNALLIVSLGTIAASFSVATLTSLDPTSNLYGVLSALNPFFLYAAYVLGLGLHICGSLNKNRAMLISFGLWLLWLLYMLIK